MLMVFFSSSQLATPQNPTDDFNGLRHIEDGREETTLKDFLRSNVAALNDVRERAEHVAACCVYNTSMLRPTSDKQHCTTSTPKKGNT